MVSRWLVRIIAAFAIIVLISPFVLKRDDGRSIMTFDEFKSLDVVLIKSRYKTSILYIRRLLGQEVDVGSIQEVPLDGPRETKLYKWKDENGEWHFSDTKPDGYGSEEVLINNNRNVMRFEDVKKKRQAEEGETQNSDQ